MKQAKSPSSAPPGALPQRMGLPFIETTNNTNTKMNKNWIVGGDDVLSRFVVSRLVRPNDKQTNRAREWIMKGKQVKVFTSREKAEKCAASINRY